MFHSFSIEPDSAYWTGTTNQQTGSKTITRNVTRKRHHWAGGIRSWSVSILSVSTMRMSHPQLLLLLLFWEVPYMRLGEATASHPERMRQPRDRISLFRGNNFTGWLDFFPGSCFVTLQLHLSYVAHMREICSSGHGCYFSTFQLALKNDRLCCPFLSVCGGKGVADNDPTPRWKGTTFLPPRSVRETHTSSHARKLFMVVKVGW